MVVVIVHGFGEKLGLVLAFAARAVVLADQENLVHAHVQGVRLEGVDQLVHQREDYLVDLGVQRAPASAVDVLVVRILARRLVKLRVLSQQRRGVLAPGLMSEALKLRNQPDVVLATFRDQLFDLLGVAGVSLPKLRMRLILESVVDLPNDDVDAHLGKPADDVRQLLHGPLTTDADVHAPPRLVASRLRL